MGIKIEGRVFTNVDFDRHYQIQQGKCLGCGKHQQDLKISLCVDHDHGTGEFRGLLCNHCNHILGLVGDRQEILTNLINYLERKNE
jgi:hypothetical protein